MPLTTTLYPTSPYASVALLHYDQYLRQYSDAIARYAKYNTNSRKWLRLFWNHLRKNADIDTPRYLRVSKHRRLHCARKDYYYFIRCMQELHAVAASQAYEYMLEPMENWLNTFNTTYPEHEGRDHIHYSSFL